MCDKRTKENAVAVLTMKFIQLSSPEFLDTAKTILILKDEFPPKTEIEREKRFYMVCKDCYNKSLKDKSHASHR